jgi:hypothetical protein
MLTALVIVAVLYTVLMLTLIYLDLRSANWRLTYIMAQIDDLNEALDAIGLDVDTTLEHVTELQQELTDLQNNTPPEVDLSGVIAKAEAIKAKLEGVSDAVTDANATEE